MKEQKVLSAEKFLLAFENKYPRLKALVGSTESDKLGFYNSAQGSMITIDVMIEFAKAHVKAALFAAIQIGDDVSTQQSVEDIINDYLKSNII